QVVIFRITVRSKSTAGLEIRSVGHPARGGDDTFLIDFLEIVPFGSQAVQPLLISPVSITDPPMGEVLDLSHGQVARPVFHKGPQHGLHAIPFHDIIRIHPAYKGPCALGISRAEGWNDAPAPI